jgi:hypothetical protein
MKLKIIVPTLIISLSGTVQANSIEFSPVKVPETDAEKSSILASNSVKIDDETYKIGYHTILRSGDKVGDGIFGQIVDFEANPILSQDGSIRISNNAEFSSLLPIGNKLFMVSHFETRPGAMYITELNQDLKTGLLTAVNTKPADFSKVKGGWVHCAGSVTPWNTHLGSEEYEPNAELHNSKTGSLDRYYKRMAAYYGGDLLKLNPYYYGYTIEVKILNEAGDYDVIKHYAMGRLAFELSYVLPDQKTVYLSNDQFKIEANKIRIPKLGWVSVTENLRFSGKIMSATVSRVADKWFVSVSVQMETTPVKVSKSQADAVGVDLGVKNLATLSNGSTIEGSKPLKKLSRKLAIIQRHLAKCTKGSKRYNQQKIKLARLHYRILFQANVFCKKTFA